MKTYKIAFIIMAAVLAAPFAHAQTMTKRSSAEFAQDVAIATTFEINSSKLALQKSKNAQIRAFAHHMIKDHTKAAGDFKTTLAKSHVKSSRIIMNRLDDSHQVVYDRLVQLQGVDFDNEYIKAQVDAHKETIAVFTDYSKEGRDAQLKAFANRTLPTLRMHQKHADDLSETLLNTK